jgi:hypothetical protein
MRWEWFHSMAEEVMPYILPVLFVALLVMIGVHSCAHAQGIYGQHQGWMQADEFRQVRPRYWDIEPSPGIRPLSIIPPIGSRSCTPVQVCDAYGNYCTWQQACR